MRNIEEQFLKTPPFNEKLNEDFKSLIAPLMEMQNNNQLKKWFTLLLNSVFLPKSKVTLEDVQSLRLIVNPSSLQDLAERYNFEFWRACFHLNEEDMKRVYKKIKESGAPAAVVIKLRKRPRDFNFLGLPYLILGYTTHKSNLFHELRHSIDPFIEDRSEGVDCILEEVIAYWGDLVFPQYAIPFSTYSPQKERFVLKDRPVKSVNDIFDLLAHSETYKNQFGFESKSPKDYQDSVKAVRSTILRLLHYYDYQQIDIILLNTQHFSDLINLLNFKDKEALNW